jgi:hypothetical protein
MVWGGPSARAAILAIANHANDDWFCWAKQSTLGRESEQSPDSIQRRVQEFISLGRVRRIKLKRFGRRTHDFPDPQTVALFRGADRADRAVPAARLRYHGRG